MATRNQLIQYAIGGVVVVAIAVGGYRYFAGVEKPVAETATATRERPAANPDEPTVPSPTQADKILQLLGQARRLAGDGKFDEANARLDEADKVVKGQPEVAQARREIAEMRSPEGQLNLQITRARFAVDHGDKAAAETAFAEIEKLKPGAPEIVELRAKLEQNQKKDTRRDDRVTQHLAAMHDAMSKQDFATANSELNAAERIAVDDPTVQQARRELNRARNAAQKPN